MPEFTYTLDEFEIDGALLSAEIQLTLSADLFEGGCVGVDFYMAEYKGCVCRAGGWIRPAMKSWVEQNQPRLIQYYYDHVRSAEAA
jgi:hypothetical protein